MSNPTRGPWKVQVDTPFPGKQQISVQSENPREEEVRYVVTVSYSPIGSDRHGRALANAHLIAAAPTMLDALKQSIAPLEPHHTGAELKRRTKLIETAIAQAEGRI